MPETLIQEASPREGVSASSSLRGWLTVRVLCWREMIRFFRQRNRVVGAIGQPLVFWLLFGAGLRQSYRLAEAGETGQNALEYLFPGSLVLILLFTAIFATISIIEDRREGFLQAVLVAPAPRWAMLLGKVLGGSAIAMIQGLIFLALAITLNIEVSLLGVALLVVMMLLTSLALTSLGMVIVWRMESTQGFHAIMSLFLMPMWLLSGAFFAIPRAGAEAPISTIAMHWVMRLNPLSYPVAGIRRLLYWSAERANLPGADVATDLFWLPSLATCWIVSIGFAVSMFAAATLISAKRIVGDSQ
jgi:ABC-2 type transport system permease protein